jgi:hypothetical protein
MLKGCRIACGAMLLALCAAPCAAQTAAPAAASSPAEAPQATTAPDSAVVVTGKPRRHGVMRFLFGRNRRRGGFFANLFHGKRHWQTTAGHRQHCKQHFHSYNSRTNSYRGYSGVRHVCVL